MKKPGRQLYIDLVIEFLNRDSRADFQEKLRTQITEALTAPRKAGLETLVSTLERAAISPSLDLEPTKGAPGDQRTVLDFGDEKFAVIRKWKRKTIEEEICTYLYAAIESGQFAFIRKCRQCPRFFASFRHDSKTCSTKCNRDYQNIDRQRTGYFRENYAQRKKLKLKMARALLRKGKARKEIIIESGLTEKMLIRAGILK